MNQIGLCLKKIHILLERRRNYEYRDYNLTSTQIDLLEYLYFHKGDQNTLSHIAAFFGVQHTSVIHVLKILETKELIYRRESPADSRRKAILLTQKGFAVMKSHLGCRAEHESLLCAGIPETDLEILERSLLQIYRNLRQNEPDKAAEDRVKPCKGEDTHAT